MSWVLVLVAVWVVVGIVAAVLVGGVVRLADQQAEKMMAAHQEGLGAAEPNEAAHSEPGRAGTGRSAQDHSSGTAECRGQAPVRRRPYIRDCVLTSERVPAAHETGSA